MIDEKDFMERLSSNKELMESKNSVSEVYFYGAGCGTNRMVTFVKHLLESFFNNAKVDVKEDTFAAVYATTNPSDKAIVCILGTGANCSYWNGEKIDSSG